MHGEARGILRGTCELLKGSLKETRGILEQIYRLIKEICEILKRALKKNNGPLTDMWKILEGMLEESREIHREL